MGVLMQSREVLERAIGKKGTAKEEYEQQYDANKGASEPNSFGLQKGGPMNHESGTVALVR